VPVRSSLNDEQPSYRYIFLLGRLEVIEDVQQERWEKTLLRIPAPAPGVLEKKAILVAKVDPLLDDHVAKVQPIT
jgi:hypothetical protein